MLRCIFFISLFLLFIEMILASMIPCSLRPVYIYSSTLLLRYDMTQGQFLRGV